jgi:hypothetical protein
MGHHFTPEERAKGNRIRRERYAEMERKQPGCHKFKPVAKRRRIDIPKLAYKNPPRFIKIRLYKDVNEYVNPTYRGARVAGRVTGLSYHGYWIWIFNINEYLPKDLKLTDFAIAMNVVGEFPHHLPVKRLLQEFDEDPLERAKSLAQPGNPQPYRVRRFRRMYNKGILLKRHGKPLGRHGPVSFRYNNDGDPVSSFNYHHVLTPEKMLKLIHFYGGERPDERRAGIANLDFTKIEGPVKLRTKYGKKVTHGAPLNELVANLEAALLRDQAAKQASGGGGSIPGRVE